MESYSNKINLVRYQFELVNFYRTYSFTRELNSFIFDNNNKILRFYIYSIKKDNLIIEVILKDPYTLSINYKPF